MEWEIQVLYAPHGVGQNITSLSPTVRIDTALTVCITRLNMNNTSHHITLQHITLHNDTLQHNTTYHITLHYITSPHITLHHLTSHHITLQNITSHHIRYHNLFRHHITPAILSHEIQRTPHHTTHLRQGPPACCLQRRVPLPQRALESLREWLCPAHIQRERERGREGE